MEKGKTYDVSFYVRMSEDKNNDSTADRIDYALIDLLVEQNLGLSEQEIMSLYQKHIHDADHPTIELITGLVIDSAPDVLDSVMIDVEDSDLRTETKSQAQYQIRKRLDSGGQSDVFLADRISDTYQQKVVIKKLKKSFYSDQQRKLLLSEMQILADLRHPNIVSIIDAGLDDSQRPWMILEFIQGLRLDHFLAEHKLDRKSVMLLAVSIAEAIEYIHEQNICHLDIKPANVLIESIHDDAWKPVIIDFGIASSGYQAAGSSLYQFATPAFAAPEQLDSSQYAVDHHSDIYSFGRLLDYMLKSSGDQSSIRNSSLSDTSKDLKAIVNKCIQHEPKDRYASMGLVLADLSAYKHGHPVSVRPQNRIQKLIRAAHNNSRWSILLLVFIMVMSGLVLVLNQYITSNKGAVQRHTRASQQYWQQAQDIKQNATLIYTRPLSNIETDFAVLNSQFESLAKRLNQEPKAVRIPAYQALAETAVVLGRYEQAQQLFQVSYQGAHNNSEVIMGLGKNYLRLYQQAMDEVMRYSSAEQRKEKRLQLNQNLIQPALDLFEQLPSNVIESNPLIKSITHYYGGDSQAALMALDDPQNSRFWPIERLLLSAQILSEESLHSELSKNIEEARIQITRAQELLGEARLLARSHSAVLKQSCKIEGHVKRLVSSNYEEKITSCDELMVVLPTDTKSRILVARTYSYDGKTRLSRGKDPQVVLDLAEQVLSMADSQLTEDRAQIQHILGQIHRIRGHWSAYNGGHSLEYVKKSIAYLQRATQLLPGDYNIKFDYAVALYSAANDFYATNPKAEQMFHEANKMFSELVQHEDATILTYTQLIRTLTDHAYHRYQSGKTAIEQFESAEQYSAYLQNTWPDNPLAYSAMAQHYWIYAEYLVFQGLNPDAYLSKSTVLREKELVIYPKRWIKRYNHISALLSGIHYHLENNTMQDKQLAVVFEHLHYLKDTLSETVDLDSHFNYYSTMLAWNQLLKNQSAAHAIQQSRLYNAKCINTEIDGYHCHNQLATLVEVENLWSERFGEISNDQRLSDLQTLNQGIKTYPSNQELKAQLGRLLLYATKHKQIIPWSEKQTLIRANQLITQALDENPMLKNRYGSALVESELLLSREIKGN